jgi:hypothetical protein
MKKHLFGFAIFSLIVAAFVMVYAFFYAPAIPPKETVKPPVAHTDTQVERPYSCRLSRNKISYEVLSSEFDRDKNKFTSKVKLTWNGASQAPEKIYIDLKFVTSSQLDKPLHFISQKIDNPFPDGNQRITTIESEDVPAGKVNKNENLYAIYQFSQNDLSEENPNKTIDLSEAKQVLFIHGEDSVIKTKIPRDK